MVLLQEQQQPQIPVYQVIMQVAVAVEKAAHLVMVLDLVEQAAVVAVIHSQPELQEQPEL
jgi:hypothetical protein